MSEKRYCERCGEDDLDTFVSTNIRPFNEYCSTDCLSGHIQDVRFDKDWADIKEDYKKESITNVFEYAKQKLEKGDYAFFNWNEQKKEYERD
jgi:hypothetical protein|tara:strand:- start:181 stop:456 length:276 start_codon:yes stop_codon:yes gene_type:complete